MTARPIFFSNPMVRAILAGTKTQTRRVVVPLTVNAQTLNYGYPESASIFTKTNPQEHP